jgi:chorismate mutase
VEDPTLDALRREIDAIDDQILGLIVERVSKVVAVGEHKRKSGLAIYDPERERRMIARLCAGAVPPLDADTVRRVFERLIDESRTIEQRHVQKR